ncbi:uncharacterized protein LOC112996488 isoform X2 [Dromaius novaehollandiae]|uniref:uncharacterized protein LOC112996488 isoform X2 n=1 Tax=Dromaius novaehollandiae TaxID=8790 RepID=UPI00311DE9AF
MIAITLQVILIMGFDSLATSPKNLSVIQTPTKVHLSVGDSTEIACIWEKISLIERYRVSWYLVNEENITKTVTSDLVYMSNVARENKDVLVIEAANVNNTGLYYCEVIIEIPFCERVYGSGTMLTVGKKDIIAEADSREKREMAILAIIPFLVAVGSLYLCYKKKQDSKLPGSAQFLMPEERHQEEQMLQVAKLHGRSESINEAAEENLSCNSAEWAVSTLYESYDLFYNEPR